MYLPQLWNAYEKNISNKSGSGQDGDAYDCEETGRVAFASEYADAGLPLIGGI